jgi:hypothetical protein
MLTWHLVDADPIAAENPYTFYKPSRGIISLVASGEDVKLIFGFTSDDPEAPSAERMWVRVDEVMPDGSFRGRLNNDPYYIRDLKAGDPVAFGSCHVINTAHDDNDNLVNRYIKRCFVTNRVLRDGQRAGHCYREEPEQDDDSGWRITANDESETEEYMANVENLAYVSLGAVLSKDDSFRELLELPVGSDYVRNRESGEFDAVSID